MTRRLEDMTKKELIAELRRLQAPERQEVMVTQLVHQVDSHRTEMRAQSLELLDAQRGIEDALSRYADLYDFGPVAYMSLSLSGVIEEVNLTATALLETDRSILMGMPLLNLVAPADRQLFLNHLAGCRSGRISMTTDLRMRRRKSGEQLEVQIYSKRSKPVGEGSAPFLRTALIDMRSTREMENALLRARDQLEQRVEERTAELAQTNAALAAEIQRRSMLEDELTQKAQLLADADHRKNEFLAMLAHELRNPLAPLLSGLEIQKHPDIAVEDRHRVLDAMLRQVRHMARLIDDLLDVGRISRGKIAITKRPVELAELMERALESVQPFMDAAGHELDVSLPDRNLWLVADPVRIVQVIANLLQNAAKFTPAGGKIALWAERSDGKAVVRVRDSGIGMSEEALARVFDPFYQADRSLDRSKGGLGLGLTLARALVDLHGGTIQARSEGPNRGSELTVSLPMLEATPPAPEPPRVGERPRLKRPTNVLRLLIVDDNVDAADALGALLKAQGYTVRTAYDARTALTIAQDVRPDVALLDIGLPGMDGYDLAQEMRKRLGEAITLVAVTGYGEDAARARSKEAGFSHHMLKPIGLETLEELFETILRSRTPPGTAPNGNGASSDGAFNRRLSS